MPTKMKRSTVNFPQDIFDMVLRDAALDDRSASQQVIHILREHYAEAEKQAELFTSPQLREARQEEIPVFETPLPVPAPVLKPRLARGQGKI